MAKPEKPLTLAEQIDELGKLEAKLAPLKPDIASAEKLRRAVADSFVGNAHQSGRLDGSEYFCLISPRGWKKRITSMRNLCKALGTRIFFANCSFTLEKFETLCPAAQQPALIANEQVGPRRVDTFHKIAASV